MLCMFSCSPEDGIRPRTEKAGIFLFDELAVAKVTDFGLSKMVEDDAGSQGIESHPRVQEHIGRWAFFYLSTSMLFIFNTCE